MQRQRRESGATAVEYGILVALISAVIISAVVTLGGSTGDAYQGYCDAMLSAGRPC